MSSPFNNGWTSREQYWNRRTQEAEFRKTWYEWREEMKEMWGVGYVASNPDFFTQRAFLQYLELVAAEEQRKAEEEQQAASLQLEAPQPPEPLVTTTDTDSSVIITDIDGRAE